MEFNHLILVGLLPALACALVAFECDNTSPHIAELSLLDVQPCTMLKKNITHKEVKIQLIQPKLFEEISYFQCLIEVSHLIYRCGKTFETFHKNAIQTELVELNREECRHLIDKGTFKYDYLKIKINKDVNINYVTAETFGKIIDTTCYPGDGILIINGITYDRAVRISEFRIMTRKAIGTVDIEEKKLILESGIKCNYNDFNCFSANDGYVYWESYFEQPNCHNDKEYLVTYEGMSTKVLEYYRDQKIISYIIHYREYDFQIAITGKINRICNQRALATEHPNLAIIEETDIGFSLNSTQTIIPKNVNLMTYFNSKLLYIVKHTKDQVDDLYQRLSYDRCLAETKITHNMMTLATLFPTQFAYEYYGKSGYSGVTRGEVLYLIKCKPVSVNVTTPDQEKCYNEIAVMHNNKKYFLTPRTRILSSFGTQVDCSSLLSVKYKFNDNWYVTTKTGLLSTKSPQIISITQPENWEFKPIKKLAELGIYTIDELNTVQKIIMSPIQNSPFTINIQRSLQGTGSLPSGSSIMNMFSEDDLKKLISETTESVWNSLYQGIQSFGNFFAFLIGIFAVIKFIKYIMNMIINSVVLYRNIGISWKLCFFWWENMVHHILRDSTSNIKRDKQTFIPLNRRDKNVDV